MGRVPTTTHSATTRKRTIAIIAAGAFVIGFAFLYLQSHNARNRQQDAREAVRGNAIRYAAAVVSGLHAGPVTGRQLRAMRGPVYQDGGGIQQGITRIGGTNGAGSVLVTYRVAVGFKGSFNHHTDSSSCFTLTVTHSTPTPTEPPPTMDCSGLLPDIAPTAVLSLS
jgi:hypothetical protein